MPLPTPEQIAAAQAAISAPWGEPFTAIGYEHCQVGGEAFAVGEMVYRAPSRSAGGPLDMVNQNRGLEFNYRCAEHAHQKGN